MTAAAYGVDEFLFVYGDRPASGARAGELTVRSMIREAREFSEHLGRPGRPFRIGVTSSLRPLPTWKQDADFVFVQVGFSVDKLLEWRASVEFEGPVFGGVMVIASAAMARKLSADIPQLAVPDEIVGMIEIDRSVGVEVACQLVTEIRDSATFDGVHLIPVSRYREVASRLKSLL